MRMLMVVIVGLSLHLGVVSIETAEACTSAGKNTHVGVVTHVNAEEEQFTITDAETNGPMVFSSTPELLSPLNIGDRIVISYTENDGVMVAKKIQH